jgi:hypothetical protein
VGEVFSHQVKRFANTIEQFNAENNLLKAKNEGLRQNSLYWKAKKEAWQAIF